MKLKVIGQNVIVSNNEGSLTKRIVDKEERDTFIGAVKAYLSFIESSASILKKQVAEKSILSLFNKETENNKDKKKVAKKIEKNKEVAVIKEIAQVKKAVKIKKQKIEKSLTQVVSESLTNEERDKLIKENNGLRAELEKLNNEKNETAERNRGGRESGSAYWS